MSRFRACIDLIHCDSLQELFFQERIGAGDLVLTTEPVQKAFLERWSGEVLLLERYGRGEPTTAMVDRMRADLPEDIGRLVAIGGGSVMDTAKLLSLDWQGTTEDLFLGRAEYAKTRGLLAVPTTCGTGSEATNAVACELVSLHTKRGLSLDAFFPDWAALIPQLIEGLPYGIFATSSIDALVHGVESYLSPKANAHTRIFSEQAIRTILGGYRYTLRHGRERWRDRADEFLTASNFAGIAFANAGCAAVHALSYPLGGGYHIPHGEANQLMFAEVMRCYKRKAPVGLLGALESLLGESLDIPAGQALEAAIALLDELLPRKPLREYGIRREEFPGFASGVIAGQQRLLGNNYTELTAEDMVAIYEICY